MAYIYQSPIGTMVIKLDSTLNKYALIINDVCYGHYSSAAAAADDVYCHATGCHEWDKLDSQVDAPTDIHEWEKISLR